MTTVTLDITGMHCEGCIAAISDALRRLPGVTVRKVDIGSASVTVDATGGAVGDVLAAVRAAGTFDVAGFTTDSA